MSVPVINLTSCDDYKRRMAAEFKLTAVAANLDGAASIPVSELDRWCSLAAEDLVRIRTICRAYKEGRLALEELQSSPCTFRCSTSFGR